MKCPSGCRFGAHRAEGSPPARRGSMPRQLSPRLGQNKGGLDEELAPVVNWEATGVPRKARGEGISESQPWANGPNGPCSTTSAARSVPPRRDDECYRRSENLWFR